ncbi:MAG: U32 family peptidase C-terminal domain-containing protein [Candidatus Nanoarchaeia archaeon]|nr:U32 family peptidase C-terminal domain-containing protein [Candidatus Nanoarchaeia archaeon]
MKPELLMPAGDLEKAKYAIAFGADAVYAGVPQFSLRVKENEFSLDQTKELIDYVHKQKKKIYITLNIYPHNNKIESFLDFLDKLIPLQPDALIMSDPGLIMLTQERYPNTEIHLSVQQNNVNYASAQFWEKVGIKRIILARELSLKEIETIKEKNPNLELEIFIHGAICIAYSGRCLLSNYLTGRDANQGQCAQSCRWQYKVLKSDNGEQNSDFTIRATPRTQNSEFLLEEKLRPNEFIPIEEDSNGTYLLNSRDLCAIDFIEDLMNLKIDSFKVEGRNKSVYYAAIVAKVYREVIDKIYSNQPVDIPKLFEELQSVGNRGYIPGFLSSELGHNSQRYDSNSLMQTHIFAGILKEKNNNEVIFEVKNKLNQNDTIEIISPNETIMVSLKNMTDENNIPLNEINPGAGLFKVILDKPLTSNFAIARLEGRQKRNS